jgi:outer membrane protein OmpA-like peptidoglycan-associated protein
MTTEATFAARSHEENWLPVLELAVEEVFGIMLNAVVTPSKSSEHQPNSEFTAMLGLAGALCGVLTVCCDGKTAHAVAKSMLGDSATSDEEVSDALGEICNMIAGNFDSGSARMKSTSLAAFDRIAAMLRQHDSRLRIEGHTDNVPIHTSQFPSNWELSSARATEIVRLLIVRNGFRPDRLSAGGFAEYQPAASNATPDGRSMNRRVDIVILGTALAGSPSTPATAPISETKIAKPSPIISATPVSATTPDKPQR